MFANFIVPPFTRNFAIQKARLAEDAWNSCLPPTDTLSNCLEKSSSVTSKLQIVLQSPKCAPDFVVV